jgi:hypothetical protein
MFLVFLIVSGVIGGIFEELLHLAVAISKKMTGKELNNVWAYKHCFKVTTVDEGKNYFEHKHYSLFQNFKNIIYFLLGKTMAKKTKRGSKEKKSSPRYQDFDVLQTSARSGYNL